MTTAVAFVKDLVDDQDLVFSFFAVFSRFEYALKRSGFLKRQDGRAEPNWDEFANTLRGKLSEVPDAQFIEARRFLLAEPPKTQVVAQGHLGWQDTLCGSGESEERYLLRLVSTVRNNLFHGGKYPYPFASVDEPSRDTRLLQAAIAILQACLTSSPQVDSLFEKAA
jgi:hypothetical protein